MDLSSVDIGKIESNAAAHRERGRVKMLDSFPAIEELKSRIEEADKAIADHSEQYKETLETIRAEKAKLPPLRDKVREAEAALAAQLAVIQRFENEADRQKSLSVSAATAKAALEAQLANKDYLRFSDL